MGSRASPRCRAGAPPPGRSAPRARERRRRGCRCRRSIGGRTARPSPRRLAPPRWHDRPPPHARAPRSPAGLGHRRGAGRRLPLPALHRPRRAASVVGAVLHAGRRRALGRRRGRAPLPAARLLLPPRPAGRARVPARGRGARHPAPGRAPPGRRAVAAGAAGRGLRVAPRGPGAAPGGRGDRHRPAGLLAGRTAGRGTCGSRAAGLPRRRPRGGDRAHARRRAGHRRRRRRPRRPGHRAARRVPGRRRRRRGLRLRPAGHVGGGAADDRGAGSSRPAGPGGGNGLRLRRLLWVRGAHPGRLPAPVRGRTGAGGGGGGGGARGVRTTFCGLELEHPVINGSGTFDAIAALRTFGDALLERFPFAAFVSKTVTVAPRQGNPPPRLWEAPAGLINSIGLPNKGVAGYLEQDLPVLARLPVPLIVNVMGFTREEVATLVATFAEREEVVALELNVSCPNVESGLVMGADPSETAALLDRVRPLTGKPLIVKLTPNAADPGAVALAAQEAGADAVSLLNTLKGMALAPDSGEPWLGGRTGGVSGPAVRAIALAQVADVAERVTIPVVGMGGVQSGRDADALLQAGATLVAVGTESFRDPLAAARIRSELADLRGLSTANAGPIRKTRLRVA